MAGKLFSMHRNDVGRQVAGDEETLASLHVELLKLAELLQRDGPCPDGSEFRGSARQACSECIKRSRVSLNLESLSGACFRLLWTQPRWRLV